MVQSVQTNGHKVVLISARTQVLGQIRKCYFMLVYCFFARLCLRLSDSK